jgi:hypothetical protein
MPSNIAPRVGTIGDLVDQGRTIWIDCEKCGHRAELDPAAIAAAHGRGLPVQRFLERCYCSGSRARYPQIGMIVPPKTSGGFPAGRLNS